jgi:hypothetical protein
MMGKPDSRLYHYATTGEPVSILQLRCHICRHVKTVVQTVTAEAQRATRMVAHRSRRLFYAAIVTWTLAISIVAFAIGRSTYAAP